MPAKQNKDMDDIRQQMSEMFEKLVEVANAENKKSITEEKKPWLKKIFEDARGAIITAVLITVTLNLGVNKCTKSIDDTTQDIKLLRVLHRHYVQIKVATELLDGLKKTYMADIKEEYRTRRLSHDEMWRRIDAYNAMIDTVKKVIDDQNRITQETLTKRATNQ